MDTEQSLVVRIGELKREKNAVVLAHNYQRGSVQNVADFTGDSYELSKNAVNTDAEMIVFCGVRFMAETASILNPEKRVLLPDPSATCELAATCTVQELMQAKTRHPRAAVVSYVNSATYIKALSDVCCTSSNAVDVVRSMPNEEIIVIPDQNLASFIAERVPDKNIIPWDGYCSVHHEINPDKVVQLRRRYPDAAVMVHPECTFAVRATADFIGSSAQMLTYACGTEREQYIVGSEDGLVHQLKRENPTKTFHTVGATCAGMKRNTLHDVLFALESEQYEIRVPETIRINALKALNHMLEI